MTDARRSYRGPLWLGEYPLAQARPSCCMPNRASATPSSSPAMRRCWRAPARRVVLEVQAALKELAGRPRQALSPATRAARRCPPMTCTARSAACRWRLQDRARRAFPPTSLICAPRKTASRQMALALEALPGKRVALSWAGNPSHANDRNRSIDVRLLEPLLALEGVSFVSIQRDLRAWRCRAAGAPSRSITPLGDELADMADTAALVALADLTHRGRHVGGASGRRAWAAPGWVLLPFAPDWRWTLTGRTQPLVPAGAAVASARAGRLAKRDRDAARGDSRASSPAIERL